MKVLLTGGTGFVGSWTGREIERAGHQVRYLVRTPDKLAGVAGALGADCSDVVAGDITDAGSVAKALVGVDAVVHCAAVVAVGPGAAKRMAETNVAGARNVIGQAAERGVRRIVHVSSVAAVSRPGLLRLTGDLPVTRGMDDYGASKARVEEYVRGVRDAGAPVDITYPTMVIGPPAGQQIGEATEGVVHALRLRVLPGRAAAWSICDVRDLGRLHAALLRDDAPGRGWSAGGHHVPVRDVAGLLTEVSGRRVFWLPLPDSSLRLAGRVHDVLRLPTPFTGPAMQYYTRVPVPDQVPAETELGVSFRAPRQTLADCVAGLREIGRI